MNWEEGREAWKFFFLKKNKIWKWKIKSLVDLPYNFKFDAELNEIKCFKNDLAPKEGKGNSLV